MTIDIIPFQIENTCRMKRTSWLIIIVITISVYGCFEFKKVTSDLFADSTEETLNIYEHEVGDQIPLSKKSSSGSVFDLGDFYKKTSLKCEGYPLREILDLLSENEYYLPTELGDLIIDVEYESKKVSEQNAMGIIHDALIQKYRLDELMFEYEHVEP